MPIKVFERILKKIKTSYGFIDLNELKNNPNQLKKGVLLTFDDAYYDFYENVFPLLQKYNIPCVLNVITDCATIGESFWTQKLNKIVEAFYSEKREKELELLPFFKAPSKNNPEMMALQLFRQILPFENKEDPIQKMTKLLGYTPEWTKMMTWKEIKEMSDFGIHIGSHSVSHANFSILKEEEIMRELKVSKQNIEQNIKKEVECIAYPNGQFTSKVIELSKDAGYKFGFSVENKSFQISDKDFQIIPRILVYHQKFWKLCLQFIKLRIENH